MCNKVHQLMEALVDNSVDFAGICETWLTEASSPITAVIKSFGFSILHNFRKEKKGGGTALIYKSCFKLSVVRSKVHTKSFEYTAATIKTGNVKSNVMFIILYRPGQMCSQFNQELDALLADLTPRCDCLVLAGDLNIHFDHSANKLYKQSHDVILSYGMKKLISEATHIGGGSLDQVFTLSQDNQLECVVKIDNMNTLGSDHFPVFCTFKLIFEKKFFKSINYRKLKDVNTEVFSEQLLKIVDDITVSGSFKSAVSSLTDQSLELLEQHAPLVSKRISVVTTAPWFDKEYRELRTLRRKAESAWKKSQTETTMVIYKDLCKSCSTLARKKKKAHFSAVVDRAEGNPRTLYQIVNKELDRKQSKKLPDFTDNIVELTSTFNSFFSDKIEKIRKNMTEDTTPTLSAFPQSANNTFLSDFEPTTLEEIKEIISDTGIKCSPADLLPQQLFKDNINILLPVIVKLVNISLLSGNIDGVKLADIVPLLKDDSLDPNILKNFRPVSNLTFIGKLIERVVLKRLNDHLSANNLHCPDQSAYRKNHSTETLLVRIWNDLLIATDEKKATVVMLLDLSAAFDTVDHGLLLRILKKEIGLRGNALQWFESFLTGRAQRIRLGHYVSEEILIKFGVPQGSVLGPVLFNIYIRSIYGCVKALGFNIHGYADDHQVIKSFGAASQSLTLIYDIDLCFQKIKHWMNQYYLQLNDSKTQIIIFGSTRVLNDIQIHGVNFTSGAAVRFIPCVKNLGIHMDSRLTLADQVVNLKKKSFMTIRNICKIRFLLSKEQLRVIVNSLVVSCLDYCNGLFYGICEKLLMQLQLVQNAAAKAITGKYKHDHLCNDLRELHWLDVRKRIIFKIGLLAYKSVNGLAPVYLQELFRYCHHGHTLQLMVPQVNSKYGQRSFSVVGPKLFNKLPTYVKTALNVDIFKTELKTYLFNLSREDIRKLV
jgi:hypothetical protein